MISWIKCSDYMPEEEQKVLALHVDRCGYTDTIFSSVKVDFFVTTYRNGFFIDKDEDEWEEITHWSPLNMPEVGE